MGQHTSTVTGRVGRVDRGACTVRAGDRTYRADWRSGALPHSPPCVGDLVELAITGEQAVVVAIAPRRTAVTRLDVAPGTSEHQVLAANVDVVAVCEPCHPGVTLTRIERLLALAWESGARPVVILTKCDLAADLGTVIEEVEPVTLGVPVIRTAVPGTGLQAVRELVAGGAAMALVGRSGAGKSTLLNAMLDRQAMPTNQLRADGRGRHTTTHRELFELPNGGFVIDTPGVKGVGLPSAAGLDAVFYDVEALARECRFNDCAHSVEPGCAVLEAVADGELPERRLESYRKLQREAAYQARRADARLAAAERAKWKSIHQELRRSSRLRP